MQNAVTPQPQRLSRIGQVQPVALTSEEAAEFLRISVSLLEQLVRQGELAPRQLSDRRVVFLVDELVEWIVTRPTSAIAPPANTGAKKPRKVA